MINGLSSTPSSTEQDISPIPGDKESNNKKIEWLIFIRSKKNGYQLSISVMKIDNLSEDNNWQ